MSAKTERPRLETRAHELKGRGLTPIEMRNMGGLGSGLHRPGAMTDEFKTVLRAREDRIEPIATAGETLKAKLGQPLFFGDLPGALSTEVMREAKRGGLSILPIPDLNPQVLTKLMDQGEPILSQWYGSKGGREEIAEFHEDGYYVLTESSGRTPIADMLHLRPGATMPEIYEAIRQHQKDILKRYKIAEGHAYVRLETMNELALDNTLHRVHSGTTSRDTYVDWEKRFFHFDGNQLNAVSMDEPVKDPRFVIVFDLPPFWSEMPVYVPAVAIAPAVEPEPIAETVVFGASNGHKSEPAGSTRKTTRLRGIAYPTDEELDAAMNSGNPLARRDAAAQLRKEEKVREILERAAAVASTSRF